jgi:hypothetical protein
MAIMTESKDFTIKQIGNDFEVNPVVGKNSGLEWDAFPKRTNTPEELNATKRKFETGAVRDSNKGKPFIHCLLGYTRQRFGYHMAKNAGKYGEFNFLKGIPTEAYLESLDRHLAAYMAGDRSEDHLSSILFGVQGLMLNEEKEGIKANHYFHDKSPAEK